MKQISNKEYEKYQQYQTDKLHGRILTPDGLRVICAGLDNDRGKSASTCWRCWPSSGMKESWNERFYKKQSISLPLRAELQTVFDEYLRALRWLWIWKSILSDCQMQSGAREPGVLFPVLGIPM